MILKNGKRIDGASIDTTPIGILSPFLGTVAPEGYLLCQGQKVSKVRYNKLYEICKDLFGTSTNTEFYLPDLRGKAITGYKEGDSTFGTLGGLIGALSHTHNIAHTHGVPGVAHTHTSAAHTHTIAGHTHTTGNHTLTVAEMPSHNHGLKEPFYKFAELNQGLVGQVYKGEKKQENTWYSEKTGGGQAHNHGNTGSTSLTTNSTTPGATGSTTPAATTTNSQSTSTSGSGSTLQPSMNLNWIVKAEMVNYTSATVYNGLDSDSTTNALSAKQGKVLNDKINNHLPLSGGTMNGEISIGQGDGYGIQLGTNGRINATLDGATNATVLGIKDARVVVGHTSVPLLLRGEYSAPLYNGVALVESGSNSNGSYIKLVDGTMICYHTKSINVECTSQWGPLYEGGTAVGNLPVTFKSAPIVMVTNTAPDGYFEGMRGTTTTTWGTLRMAIPTSATRTFTVNFLAIGKWK